MNAPLLILCSLGATLGGVVLRWRWLARDGFGLGLANRPLLVASPIGNAVVLLLGLTLLLAPAAVVFVAASWVWAALTLLIGLVAGPLLTQLLVRGDLASAREQMARFEREYSGMDAITAAMKMHLKNGTITQEQFDEFLRTKASRESR